MSPSSTWCSRDANARRVRGESVHAKSVPCSCYEFVIELRHVTIGRVIQGDEGLLPVSAPVKA
jgi:hypothetical protein